MNALLDACEAAQVPESLLYLLYSQECIGGFNLFASRDFTQAQLLALTSSTIRITSKRQEDLVFAIEPGTFLSGTRDSRAQARFPATALFVVAVEPLYTEIVAIRDPRLPKVERGKVTMAEIVY